jgi:hypothetical protein
MGLSAAIKRGGFPYDVVVLDSLTSVAAASQNATMYASSKLGVNPQIQHWGLLLNDIERVIVYLRALNVLVVVIAHETTFTADDINKIEIAIPGQKLPGKITRMFSEIWYFRTKPAGQGIQELYLQTVPTSSITCRSGRGLPTGTCFGRISKAGLPTASVSAWDLVEKIRRTDKEPTT